MITGGQAKAARRLLGLTQLELAHRAHVAPSTVANLEAKGRVSHPLLIAIHQALESAGVEFAEGELPQFRPAF
jgi:transcriptional regulator with XRE-family HTH domain